MGQAGSSSHLLGTRASPGAKEMAALSGLAPEAPAAVALRAAVELGELLAVVGALAPAAGGAGLVAGDAAALGLLELVDVEVPVAGAGDDLFPLDGLDVAQVVVVHDAHAPLQDVCKNIFCVLENELHTPYHHAQCQLSMSIVRPVYRGAKNGWYVVGRNLFLFFLNCSAWLCLGPA